MFAVGRLLLADFSGELAAVGYEPKLLPEPKPVAQIDLVGAISRSNEIIRSW
jgi:hypothetical protein